MKILQVLPELNSGGVERGTIELAAFLAREGHEALVVSNGGRQVDDLEAVGGRHIEMPVHKKSVASFFQVRTFRKLLEKERPDILHVRSRVPAWIAWLAWRKMDPRTRPRFVSTVHGFYSVSPYSEIMCRGERVIVVSESVRDYVSENYPKTDLSKVRRVYRGIDPTQYFADFKAAETWLVDWQKAFPETEGKKLVVLPGRITRLKGHRDFFKLIVKLREEDPQIHALVVGDTHPKKRSYMDELRGKVNELGLADHVTFTGHRTDLREIMSISSLVCALSQQPESFGRTVLEALALGKPVVGYDCGGVGEILAKTFPLGRVPMGDSNLLLKNAQLALTGTELPEIPKGEFTLQAMCEETLAVYRELVSA